VVVQPRVQAQQTSCPSDRSGDTYQDRSRQLLCAGTAGQILTSVFRLGLAGGTVSGPVVRCVLAVSAAIEAVILSAISMLARKLVVCGGAFASGTW
jgi:hypothetical protein